jgi:hypothetical protein
MSVLTDAFNQGLLQIFTELFTKIDYYPFKNSNVPDDIYGEKKNKEYDSKVELLANVSLKPEKNITRANEFPEHDAFIVIPVIDIINKGVEFNLDALRKGKFMYGGYDLSPVTIEPNTNINGQFLTIKVFCKILRRNLW